MLREKLRFVFFSLNYGYIEGGCTICESSPLYDKIIAQAIGFDKGIFEIFKKLKIRCGHAAVFSMLEIIS